MSKIKDLSKLSDEDFEIESKRRQKINQEKKQQAQNDYETLKIEVIDKLVDNATIISEQLKSFKALAFGDMSSLYQLLQEYSGRHADGKGNFQIEHKNSRIKYKKQGSGSFDERSDQAEKHIVEFLEKRYNSDVNTKDLIMSLLERKKGELDINLVQRLYQMEDRFEDENWKKGIELLKESYTYAHSKDYIQFSKRDENGEWQTINLQFSRA